MKLSEHFTLYEFTRSQEAIRRGIYNQPNAEQLENIKALVDNILEPIRIHFDKPVSISSGLRLPALNIAIGGSSTSSHMNGEAADFEIYGIDNFRLARWIADNCPAFDQLILEFYNENVDMNSGWIHCSFSRKKNRRQVLTATRKNGRTIYLPGLIKLD